MKKGFTLIELLGVIALLAVIALIAVPSITKTLTQGRESLSETQEKQIINGAKDYYAEHIKELPSSGNSKNKTINEIQEAGYLPEKIIDPKNGKEINTTATKVQITNNSGQYKYEIINLTYKS